VAVLASLDAADEAPASTGRDVAQLLDIDVDQRSGVIMLVATDDLTGTNIDV
jgi:hypothetical protein